jgi:hypothetical protein
MLKHVSNFFLQIFPSVVATVVGAYIVTNYITNKPAADAPKAAVASTAEPARDADPARDASPAAPSAKDIQSEDADKPKQAEKPAPDSKRQPSREKSAEKPAEKPVKAAPVAAVTSAPAQTVAVAPAAPAATAPASENRDANDLARAALDRLRGPVEAAKQPAETRQSDRQSEKPPEPQRQAAPARAAEPPKVAAATPAQPHVQQTVQPLPPAMLVTAPNNAAGSRSDEASIHKPRELARDERSLTSFRPPADIPAAPPLDLQAASREPTSIADDVVATARSVFNAVIPR